MNCDGNLIFLRAVIFTMNNLHTMSTFIFYVHVCTKFSSAIQDIFF